MDLWLIPALPLIGVVLNLTFGKLWGRNGTAVVACSVVGVAFIWAVRAVMQLTQMASEQPMVEEVLFTWLPAGNFQIDVAFLLDPLSSVMVLVVTGVSFLIHVYSIGYMHHDAGFKRFFLYLNLFVGMMLILVLGNSYALAFIGWEGVGLCSYLLIGFWYEDKVNSDAGKKAFIVNRIGDLGFILAMLLLFRELGTLNFQEVFTRAEATFTLHDPRVFWITLLIFVGAVGKSAQIPLFVWLPDAMAGPTPVSALIHAATMVTAGVYMVARSSVLYMLSPTTMMIVASIGALTALVAATIAVTQNDIKKVLAYSTVSQLGYMFLAVGVGAFGAGVFHLMTHAFFKGLLFLGAGSVMHAMGDEQDMRKMGDLGRHLPATFLTMFAATLAISGVPLFAGFFSKDQILWAAFSGEHGHIALWAVGFLGAGLTAFYMFRLLFMTFVAPSNLSEEQRQKVHESPRVMTLPLMVLGVLSVIGGYIGVPEFLGGANRFIHFLDPVFNLAGHGGAHHDEVVMEWLLTGLSTVMVFGAIGLSYLCYVKNPDIPKNIAARLTGLYTLLLNKYYFDELYNAVIVQPLMQFSNWLWKVVDALGIDGAANGIAALAQSTGRRLRLVQTGYVQSYALSVIIGAVLIVGYWLFA
jgi:NADH-quinone oxidoreductase subunit L